MRIAITITYLGVMAIAISLLWVFQPPTDNGILLMFALATAWILSLPWSLLTILVMWWFMHEYAEPIFLGFFVVCAILNALLFNLSWIRHQLELWNYNRKHGAKLS